MNDSTQEKNVNKNVGNETMVLFSATKKLLRPSDDTLFLVRLMARVLSPAY